MLKNIKFKYIIASVVMVAVIATGSGVLVYRINQANTNKTVACSEQSLADATKAQALVAYTNKRYIEANLLYHVAEKLYQHILATSPDQSVRDYAQNMIIDCEAQIYFISILRNQTPSQSYTVNV
ncbi:MAG: hypothetical protein NTV39_01395 [Candidatus Saccharibacteria bacterium]|nr:hypothetical protein [Candidatus Saccharibacteria bacterium]